MQKPGLLTRISFWLILGLLSTFFAETLSGSAPDFLLTSFGYLGIFPIYCLHTLLLASFVICKQHRFSLRSLFFASLLFGMYEAYITKVLWFPPWNPETPRIANVAVFETLLLVFFWHAIFSFIIPLFISEYLLAKSSRLHNALPEKWKERVSQPKMVILFGFIASILLGNSVPTAAEGIGITLINLFAVSAAILLWRLFTRKKSYDLVDLLPHKIELIILGVLLLVVYLNFGFTLNRQIHPGFIGHTAILAMYAGIIFLTLRSVRNDREKMPTELVQPTSFDSVPAFQLKHWFLFCGTLLAGVILINLIPQEFQDLLAGFMFLLYSGLGVVFFFISLKNLLFKHDEKREKTL